MGFQQVFDMKQIDELAKAQLLWYTADFLDATQPYCYAGKPPDLPSAHAAKSQTDRRDWEFFILLEE